MVFQPKYREGYPRFDIVEAKAETEQREKDLCRFINERGGCLGDASIDDFDLKSGVLRLKMYVAGPYIERFSGTVPMPIEPAPNGVDEERLFLRCRGCKGRFAVLFFKDAWACGKCHKLLYRRQLLTPGVILYERFTSLQKQFGRGKPHGWRQSTFEPYKAELDHLAAYFKDRIPQWASEEHSYRIDTVWVQAKDFPGDIFSSDADWTSGY